jgi:hypothetical protein
MGQLETQINMRLKKSIKENSTHMYQLLSLVIITLFCYCNNETNVTTAKAESVKSSDYKKEDLKKIKWIEGKWKGLYNGQPFYEIYKMLNDSTLEVTTFDWNGKDSSNTDRSHVQWQDGFYYLGKEKNYKAVSITDKEIVMKRNNKANNDVIWRYSDANSWDAILEHNKGVTRYHMERFDPIK